MAEKQTNKERLKDITDSIERGIQDLFQSDKYAEYLRTMSRFHKYSVNNQMLIYMQKPNATLVAGFNKWRDQFERNVMKGEKGIKIIAPTPFKKKIEQEKRDPDTNLPMLDADGKVIIEEKEIKIPMYKPVTVFDVSQTEGKPLPQLASDLSGNVQNYEVFLEALRRSAPVPIEIIPIRDGSDGFFSLDNQKISIREGMSEVQTVSAVVHEIAHSKLHNTKKMEEPKDAPKYQEVEIFDVPALFSNGRVTSADVPEGMYCYDLRGSDDDPGVPVTVENRVAVNHAGSLITAKPLELPELRASLETINKTSSELISDIDRHYAEIMKERETEMIAAPEEEKNLEEMNILEMVDYFMEQGMTEEQANDLANSEWQARKTNQVSVEGSSEPVIELPVEEVPPVQASGNGDMPDPSMSIEAMNAYGYTDSDMLPLSKERALELFERDVPIYMLYDGNTEAMAFEAEDIVLFSGCFGITREDWDAIKSRRWIWKWFVRSVNRRFTKVPAIPMPSIS